MTEAEEIIKEKITKHALNRLEEIRSEWRSLGWFQRIIRRWEFKVRLDTVLNILRRYPPKETTLL